MKVSNREKIMLCVLGIILVGFGYYNFIYSFQAAQIEEKLKAEAEIKQKYTAAMETINSLEDRKSDIKILKAKISDESVPFYPTISEEHIILELDTLLKDSGLNGTIKFEPIVSNSVENADKKNNTLAESSLQEIVDKYNNEMSNNTKNSNSNDKANNDNSTSNAKINNSDSSNKNNSSSNASKDKKKNTVHYVKLQVDFQGSYDGLNKFLSTIDQNEKKITVNSLKLSSDSSNGIKGTISLEIYSIPKINDELESYLKWDLNNTYGKSIPFIASATSVQPNTGVVGITSGEAKVQENNEPSDFIALVKPIASDLPTIMIGKAKDDSRTTYVYADSNSEEKVEMILTQDGDKYYYKYKTSKGTFPANYDGLGVEFVPASKNITFDILSRSRLDANDNSALRLKIVNKTDKLLNVNISGDDSNNPRVKVEGDLSNISVNNK
jgi:type IV pilus assembly protein PilO